MSFLNPTFLWAFLSLIPLVAIYLLKVRPQRKYTTAYFLWKRILSEKRSNALFQRLRDLFSLLLMLLAFSAIVMAMTEPELTQDERKDLLLLIDHSASMAARTESASLTRLDEAKQTAIEIVSALNGNQRAAVASISHKIRYKSHLSRTPGDLIDAIQSIEQSDLAFASQLLKTFQPQNTTQWGDQEYRIILISDGSFQQEKLPDNIELIKIGENMENVGFVEADLQYLPSGVKELSFYLQLASSYKKPVERDIIISYDNPENIMKILPLTITPGVNEAEIFPISNAPAGRWILQIEQEDSLSKDNTVYLIANRQPSVHIDVQAEDHYFFEHSVLAFSNASGLLTLDPEDPELTLAQSLTPTSPLALIFQPEGTSSWWNEIGSTVESIIPKILLEDHPAIRFLDISAISFAGAREITPTPGALVLVESDTGIPLIYQINKGSQSAMIVNMDPAESAFYFSTQFPVLIHEVGTYLANRNKSTKNNYKVGSAALIPGARQDTLTSLKNPDSSERKTNRPDFFVEKLGFYELKNNAGNWQIGASLLNEQETLLNSETLVNNAQPIAQGRSPAYLLTLLAVGLLVTESILYHRRKVG